MTEHPNEEAAFKLAVQAVAEGSPTPFQAEALDAAILEPEAELRRLPTPEIARRVQGMPFIGNPERKNSSR
jgi:hypothetical protein